MWGLQHRNYIYKGTHGHPASKLYKSNCRAFVDISSHTVHVNISPSKLLQNMVLVDPNYQNLKLLSHTVYICDRSLCESPYANRTRPWSIRCYNKWLILQFHIFHTSAQRMNLLPHAVHIHWRMLVHYNDVIMGAIASQITSLTIVYPTIYSDADERKHQSSCHWPLCREFTGVRWIPRTNGQ